MSFLTTAPNMNGLIPLSQLQPQGGFRAPPRFPPSTAQRMAGLIPTSALKLRTPANWPPTRTSGMRGLGASFSSEVLRAKRSGRAVGTRTRQAGARGQVGQRKIPAHLRELINKMKARGASYGEIVSALLR